VGIWRRDVRRNDGPHPDQEYRSKDDDDVREPEQCAFPGRLQTRAAEHALEADEVIHENRPRRRLKDHTADAAGHQEDRERECQSQEHESVEVNRVVQVGRVERSRPSIKRPGQQAEGRHQDEHGAREVVNDRATRPR
jgi:hypothetical protein